MATTKTIQPTGTTITIPAMTDKPNASVFSTDVDRITDAVNSLNSKIKTLKITYRPENNIAAGESGLFTVSVPEEVKGKTILAVSFGINHVGQAYGYQLSGTYIPTLNDAYISYYAPRAITAANADFDMTIAYM